MKYCNKCGNELNDEAKFCTKCGSPVEELKETDEEYYEEDYKEEHKVPKGKIIAIVAIIIVLILGAVGVGVYFYTVKSENVKLEKSIEIKDVSTDNYPTVSIIIEAKNFDDEIVPDNIAIKEGEVFPKNIAVEKSGDDSRYSITYNSPSDNAGKNLTVELEYTNSSGDDIKCNTSYTAPELKTEKSTKNSTSLNTYDPNVEIIKNTYDSFIKKFISMVNYGNISYINDYVVIGSDLYNDFITSIDSFKKQEIYESLEGYTIQDVKKINENTYELYVYESYYINYGKEHSSKIKTFNSIYTVQKSGDSFKFTGLKYADK
ncbi:MAG: zinc ribbon domain-containing protein [Clostridiales bacterium]|nr:zinc ribbon domain-containing protein [Clostridiales bacterium]MDY2728711.1 zinc ribbon domain-containing protein [Clostridium sp.]